MSQREGLAGRRFWSFPRVWTTRQYKDGGGQSVLLAYASVASQLGGGNKRRSTAAPKMAMKWSEVDGTRGAVKALRPEWRFQNKSPTDACWKHVSRTWLLLQAHEYE